MYAKLRGEKFFVGRVMRGLLLYTPTRMGVYTRAALQTTVLGWAATCDEQTARQRAMAYTARA